MKTMTKTGGCGCGGKKAGGCNCGCKSAASTTGTDVATACAPCDDAAFVRPQFFAGQLLTEDDLTALETYVVGKNRLHNAKLFGAGVVCGLEVSCGPCDGTTVVVGSGYALDCCGNDLVLTCDREIDLKPLIIALREQKHGKGDCGSPCDDEATKDPKKDSTTATKTTSSSTPAKKSAEIEYCLWLRYTEASSDPIANYPNPDDCAVSCQPTRVREGVSFELRCPQDPVRDDLVTHLEACIGRLSSPDRATGDGRTLEIAGSQMRRALALVDKPMDKPDPSELDRWNARQPELARIAEQANREYQPTGDDLVGWTEVLVDVGGLWLRMRAEKTEALTTSSSANAGIAFDYMVKELSDETQRAKIGSALDQLTAEEAVTLHKSLSDGALRKTPSYEEKLYLRGAAYSRKLRAAYIATAQDLRGKLMQALGCDGGNTSDCTLYDDLRNLSVPASNQGNERTIEAGDAADLANFAHKLGGYVKRFFMDCICRAFNPPCASCDDTGVLLACIRVRDCNVVEVCNMARTYVLSPAAMRYWLPPITWLGDLLAKLCCPSDACGDDLTRGGTDAKTRWVAEIVRHPSLRSAALALPAFYHSGTYLPSLVAASRSFSDLAVRRLLPGETAATVFHAAPQDDMAAMKVQLADLHARMEAYDAKAKKGPKS